MPTFRTFFHGPFSGFEVTCLKSFLDFGHRVVVYTYDASSVPSLFERADADQVIPRVELDRHLDEMHDLPRFSDYFRYTLLERHQDIWVDTDVLCLSDRWPGNDEPIVAGWEDDNLVCNAVLRVPNAMASVLRAEAAGAGRRNVYGATGPSLLTRVLEQQGKVALVREPTTFYPLHWRFWLAPFDAGARERTSAACGGATALHLWHELIRRSAIQKNWKPPQNTFFGEAVRRHGTESFFEPYPEDVYHQCVRQEAAAMLAAAEASRRWLENERQAWMEEARSKSDTIEELNSALADVTAANAWSEEQRAAWQSEADKRADQIRRLEDRVRSLTERLHERDVLRQTERPGLGTMLRNLRSRIR